MDPYGIALFVLLGIVFLGVLFAFKDKLSELFGGFGFDSTGLRNYITTWFSLVPYAVFLAGPIVDIMSSRFMYTKASLVGFAMVLVVAFVGSNGVASFMSNWVPSVTSSATGVSEWNTTGLIIAGVGVLASAALIATPIALGNRLVSTITPAIGFALLFLLGAANGLLGDASETIRVVTGDSSTSYAGITIEDVCATPGLGCVQTVFAPTGILLNTTILACHFFEALDTGNTQGMAAVGAVGATTFIIELLTLISKGCISAYKYTYGAPFISLGLGVGAGAGAYYAMKAYAQEMFTPSDQSGGVFHPPPPVQKATKTDSEKLSTKIVVGPQPETSEPVDDQDAFVCEAYKDGELITSTIVD